MATPAGCNHPAAPGRNHGLEHDKLTVLGSALKSRSLGLPWRWAIYFSP